MLRLETFNPNPRNQSYIFFPFLSSHAQDQWTYFAYLQYIHTLKQSFEKKQGDKNGPEKLENIF